jgi:hypothetical protein
VSKVLLLLVGCRVLPSIELLFLLFIVCVCACMLCVCVIDSSDAVPVTDGGSGVGQGRPGQ